MINEVKLFSAAVNSSRSNLTKILKAGSVSDADVKNRIANYEKIFSRYTQYKNDLKMYSSYVESDLLANQYFNATTAGLAKSMAGFLSIERDMDQPTALLWYLDLIGVTSNTAVLPNIGTESISGFGNNATATAGLTTGTYAYSIALLSSIVPGSFKMTLVVGGVSYIVTDNKEGALVTNPGVLSIGTINYTSGAVAFTTITNPTTATDSYTIYAAKNQTGESNVNRFKAQLEHYAQVTAYPELLVAETNLASLAAMRKSIGVDVQDVVVSKLTELYTKMVNQKLVLEIVNNQVGASVTIDLDPTQYHDFRSGLDLFAAQLVNVDTALAVKSVKGVKATAYVVGTEVVNQFRKLAALGIFVDAPQSYINDLVGYYKGIPVLEHTDIDSKTGYAVHKTIDGNLAPVIRGIYLPLTNTPAVGNYQNPTQLATGVFYQEKNQSIVSQLSQKFTIINNL